MESSAAAFLSEIEAFLAREGVSSSTFGRAAIGDPNFVRELREGRAPGLRLVDRARAYMARQRGRVGADAPSGAGRWMSRRGGAGGGAPAGGTRPLAPYRATRGPLMGRPPAVSPVAPPQQLLRHPSCGPAHWLPELIAFNEELRRLFAGGAADADANAAKRIRDVVAAHYRISVAEIIGNGATRRCSWP